MGTISTATGNSTQVIFGATDGNVALSGTNGAPADSSPFNAVLQGIMTPSPTQVADAAGQATVQSGRAGPVNREFVSEDGAQRSGQVAVDSSEDAPQNGISTKTAAKARSQKSAGTTRQTPQKGEIRERRNGDADAAGMSELSPPAQHPGSMHIQPAMTPEERTAPAELNGEVQGGAAPAGRTTTPQPDLTVNGTSTAATDVATLTAPATEPVQRQAMAAAGAVTAGSAPAQKGNAPLSVTDGVASVTGAGSGAASRKIRQHYRESAVQENPAPAPSPTFGSAPAVDDAPVATSRRPDTAVTGENGIRPSVTTGAAQGKAVEAGKTEPQAAPARTKSAKSALQGGTREIARNPADVPASGMTLSDENPAPETGPVGRDGMRQQLRQPSVAEGPDKQTTAAAVKAETSDKGASAPEQPQTVRAHAPIGMTGTPAGTVVLPQAAEAGVAEGERISPVPSPPVPGKNGPAASLRAPSDDVSARPAEFPGHNVNAASATGISFRMTETGNGQSVQSDVRPSPRAAQPAPAEPLQMSVPETVTPGPANGLSKAATDGVIDTPPTMAMTPVSIAGDAQGALAGDIPAGRQQAQPHTTQDTVRRSPSVTNQGVTAETAMARPSGSSPQPPVAGLRTGGAQPQAQEVSAAPDAAPIVTAGAAPVAGGMVRTVPTAAAPDLEAAVSHHANEAPASASRTETVSRPVQGPAVSVQGYTSAGKAVYVTGSRGEAVEAASAPSAAPVSRQPAKPAVAMETTGSTTSQATRPVADTAAAAAESVPARREPVSGHRIVDVPLTGKDAPATETVGGRVRTPVTTKGLSDTAAADVTVTGPQQRSAGKRPDPEGATVRTALQPDETVTATTRAAVAAVSDADTASMEKGKAGANAPSAPSDAEQVTIVPVHSSSGADPSSPLTDATMSARNSAEQAPASDSGNPVPSVREQPPAAKAATISAPFADRPILVSGTTGDTESISPVKEEVAGLRSTPAAPLPSSPAVDVPAAVKADIHEASQVAGQAAAVTGNSASSTDSSRQVPTGTVSSDGKAVSTERGPTVELHRQLRQAYRDAGPVMQKATEVAQSTQTETVSGQSAPMESPRQSVVAGPAIPAIHQTLTEPVRTVSPERSGTVDASTDPVSMPVKAETNADHRQDQSREQGNNGTQRIAPEGVPSAAVTKDMAGSAPDTTPHAAHPRGETRLNRVHADSRGTQTGVDQPATRSAEQNPSPVAGLPSIPSDAISVEVVCRDQSSPEIVSRDQGQNDKVKDTVPDGSVIPARTGDTFDISRQTTPAKGDEAKSVLHQSILDQIKHSVVTHDSKGNGRITIRLNPEELGELQIHVRVENHQVKVEVVTENRMVRDALMGNLETLKDTLLKQNLSMEKFNVSLGNGNGFGHASGEEKGSWKSASNMHYDKETAHSDIIPEAKKYAWTGTENSLVDLRL